MEVHLEFIWFLSIFNFDHVKWDGAAIILRMGKQELRFIPMTGIELKKGTVQMNPKKEHWQQLLPLPECLLEGCHGNIKAQTAFCH